MPINIFMDWLRVEHHRVLTRQTVCFELCQVQAHSQAGFDGEIERGERSGGDAIHFQGDFRADREGSSEELGARSAGRDGSLCKVRKSKDSSGIIKMDFGFNKQNLIRLIEIKPVLILEGENQGLISDNLGSLKTGVESDTCKKSGSAKIDYVN